MKEGYNLCAMGFSVNGFKPGVHGVALKNLDLSFIVDLVPDSTLSNVKVLSVNVYC